MAWIGRLILGDFWAQIQPESSNIADRSFVLTVRGGRRAPVLFLHTNVEKAEDLALKGSVMVKVITAKRSGWRTLVTLLDVGECRYCDFTLRSSDGRLVISAHNRRGEDFYNFLVLAGAEHIGLEEKEEVEKSEC